jgi:lipopolysaccharide export system protein LptA
MWGDLSIAAAESAVGLPERLQGTAEEMRFEPGGSLVTLDGDPALSFAGGRVRASQLLLDVGAGARQLREIRAIGSATLALGDPAAGAVPREARARTLAGDELTVRFEEGAAIDAVAAHGTPAGPARLTLPNQGELQARRIELGPTGQEQTVTATGEVRWVAARGAMGPRELAAGRLDLVVGAEGLQSIDASADVRARLADADGASRRLAGPRLSMRLVDGVLGEASMPGGVEMSLDGRSVTAATATLKDGSWVMTGTPRPRLSDPEVALEADQLTVRPDGEFEATGGVTGTLGGSRLAAGAALFGSATSVQLHAGSATVGPRGQTVLREAVQITWQSQSLIAAELRLEADPGRLRGSGGVELVALAGGEGAAGDFVTVSGRDLLVEQESSAIHVAGEAALNQGNRRISAERMEVAVDEGGAWSLVLAQGTVQFRQPGTEATGDRLEYDLSSGELLLLGTTDRPATFVYDELEYRSAEALRVRWEGEDVIIEATESGRTITKVVRTSAVR